MRKQIILLAAVFLFFAGCASAPMKSNQLRNLTDNQSSWFERTSEGWRFN